jgi:hypothetical protein
MHARTTLVDLVPRGNRFFRRLWVGAIVVLAVLEVCYAAMPWLSPSTTDGVVAAFDLDSEGSLAVWVSSTTLLLAGVAAGVVHVLQNSLPGPRTRLWLWAALCWTVMSIDESASLHEAFKELMSHATGMRLLAEGIGWWVIAYFVVLSTTGALLLWDMRRCRAACVALAAVAGFYAVAVLCELGLIAAKDMAGVMLEEGCEMLGNFCLLTAMLMQARYVARSHDARAAAAMYAWTAPDDALPTSRLCRDYDAGRSGPGASPGLTAETIAT